MTVYSAAQGTRKDIRTKVTGATAVTLYTGSALLAYIESINVAEINGGADTIDIYINDGSSDFYICKGEAIAANTRTLVKDLPLNINSGDTLKFKAGTGTAIDVTGTIIEQAPQGR